MAETPNNVEKPDNYDNDDYQENENTGEYNEPDEREDDSNQLEDSIGVENDDINSENDAEAPRPIIRNVQPVNICREDGTSEIRNMELTAAAITAEIKAVMDGFPKRLDRGLFVVGGGNQPRIRLIRDHAALFAEIRNVADVRWSDSRAKVINASAELVTVISRDELFKFLCGPADIDTYDTVEPWPHEPVMDGSFYLPREIPEPPQEGEFSPLSELLSRLNADSEHDRNLLLAMALTLVWGGLPGNRPAFALTSEHGRGTGKTTTVEVLSSIVGGCIGINPEDRDDRIFSRLLSEQGREYRVVLYDNLKNPLSNAIIEASITSEWIQGHRLHHGQDRRKNTLVTIFTANKPQLSTDMAQRAIEIKVGPRQSEDFRTWAFGFIDHHREIIIAELLAILRGPYVEEIDAENLTRWGDWMVAVLSRVPGANGLATLIRERSGACDIDAEDCSDIATRVRALLRRYLHDPETATVFIPGRLMLAELCEARLLDAGAQQRAATTLVKQHAGSGDLAPLRAHVHGPPAERVRGWLWTGPDAPPHSDIIALPEEDRID